MYLSGQRELAMLLLQKSTNRALRLSAIVIVLIALFLTALPSPAIAAPVANTGYWNSCGDCYVVKPGDTLSEIARWHGVSVWSLAEANGITNLNKIYAGQKLRIPQGGCLSYGCGYEKPGKYDHFDKGGSRYGYGGYENNYKQPTYNPSGCFSCGYYGKPDYGHNNCGGCGYEKPNQGCGGCGYEKPNHGGHKPGYGSGQAYVVRHGDTLSEIARRYGVSVHYLVSKNGISDPNRIYAGQVIYI
jgi:LysM repeat protein